MREAKQTIELSDEDLYWLARMMAKRRPLKEAIHVLFPELQGRRWSISNSTITVYKEQGEEGNDRH